MILRQRARYMGIWDEEADRWYVEPFTTNIIEAQAVLMAIRAHAWASADRHAVPL